MRSPVGMLNWTTTRYCTVFLCGCAVSARGLVSLCVVRCLFTWRCLLVRLRSLFARGGCLFASGVLLCPVGRGSHDFERRWRRRHKKKVAHDSARRALGCESHDFERPWRCRHAQRGGPDSVRCTHEAYERLGRFASAVRLAPHVTLIKLAHKARRRWDSARRCIVCLVCRTKCGGGCDSALTPPT